MHIEPDKIHAKEGPATGHITFSKYNDRTASVIILDDGRKFNIDQLASNIYPIPQLLVGDPIIKIVQSRPDLQ